MPRTLITGAAGFTGRYLASLLAERGHAVHALVQSAPGEPVAGAAGTHIADLIDGPGLQQLIERIRPDHVVHLAAIAFVAHGDVGEMYRTNVFGTRQLLQALVDAAAPVASLVLASSANIYGNSRLEVLDEQAPVMPANDYGVTKAAMEMVADLYRARLPIIVARPFNYTGRGQSGNFLIPKIVAHARDRADVIELGNVDVSRDFSDVRSVVAAYAGLLDAPGAVGETFNISSGRATSLREVVDTVGQLSGHPLEIRVNPDFVRANEVRTMRGASEKLDGVIGESRRIPLEDTLRWMLDDA